MKNQNPYKRRAEYIIKPFPAHPDFQIVCISGTNTIIFEPCNIAMSVEFDDRTNKAENVLCAPKDWKHWHLHYLKYLLLWCDFIVGGSKWKNNTHAELGNRERKIFLKRINHGKPMRLDMYLNTIIPGNMAIQMYWVTMLCEKEAVSKIKDINDQKKLHGQEDTWMRGGASKDDRAAYSPASIALGKYYCTYINQNNLTGTNITRKIIRHHLNDSLKAWKEVQLKEGFKRYGESSNKFSDEVVRCLDNGFELGDIGQPKTEMFQIFFQCVNK